MEDPCIQSCIANDQAGWQAFVDVLGPCVCASGECDTVCATTLCADPVDYDVTTECGNCGLWAGQSECLDELVGCQSDPVCGPFTLCMVACW